MEISVVANGIQKGVSRELVDSLRSQVEEKQDALNEKQEALATLQKQLLQEQAEHRRSKEAAALETQRLKTFHESLQKNHSDELRYAAWLLIVSKN